MLSACSSLAFSTRPGAASEHPIKRVLPSSDFAGTKLRARDRRAADQRSISYDTAIGTVGCRNRRGQGDVIIRCSTTKESQAPIRQPADISPAIVSEQTLHVKLTIRKVPTCSWPPSRVHLQLVSSTNVDPVTGEGVRSSAASLAIPPSSAADQVEETVTLDRSMFIPQNFGSPGAVLLQYSQHGEEFFLESMSVRTYRSELYHFYCNSWINETKAGAPRVFFSNQVYLPNGTPRGLAPLRRIELEHLRGDGSGRRTVDERIYDYDVYNDLGDPDNDQANARPVLGGSEALLYPRRCRTGRESTIADPSSEAPESGTTPFYVPRDEQFSSGKQAIFDATVNASRLAAAARARPEWYSATDESPPIFESFEEIYDLYGGGFPQPPIIQGDKSAWSTDEEFARQRLAGLNPLVIERVKEFPIVSALDPQIYGPPTSAITAQHIEHLLEGLTVDQAVAQKKLFILDYHDALLPYLERILNESEVSVYASRTLFFLTEEGVLMPIAIELSFPPHQQLGGHHVKKVSNRVFTSPVERIKNPIGGAGEDKALMWIWQLAKAHVVINDTGYHQLISHWVRTHACVEPFVIATHRQMSVLHPVHRLLSPHFKDNMSINGLARKNLISSGGIIESTFFPHRFCMEVSSVVYKSWRFDEQALPKDLIKRGMAEIDAENGLSLIIKDYPFAVDGLELWAVIQTWVRDYLAIYYDSDETVRADLELQSWWKEIKETGHGDHSEGEWWGTIETINELEKALVTLIWMASGLHAAVNFGQYAYAGFMPNSPTTGRRFIPETTIDNSEEYAELRRDPERFFLSSLATKPQAITVMGTLLLLSRHIEQEFVGERSDSNWTSDPKVFAAFDKFVQSLHQLEANIQARNDQPKNRHRYGPAQIPYKLLFPSSDQGITNQGVPNSISI